MTEQFQYDDKVARELFDKIGDLFEGKSMGLTLAVLINCVRGLLAHANPQQQQMIMITLLENLGIGDDSDPETTLQ